MKNVAKGSIFGKIILFIVQQEGNIVCKLRVYMIICVNLMFPLNLEYEI